MQHPAFHAPPSRPLRRIFALTLLFLPTWVALANTAESHTESAPSPAATTTPIPTPPSTHPRLYLRADQAGAPLAARLRDPVLQPVVKRLRQAAERTVHSPAAVEWAAINYLANPNRDDPNVADSARQIVADTLALMQKCELGPERDACRVTGRMMVTGAIVYDWLYPLLTAEQKKAFIAEFVRLAKTQECGYPPVELGAVTGHNSEAMLMRDILSAGVAIYDEFPEMYQLAATRILTQHVPARNWFYDGGAHHQGDSYGTHRYSWETFPLYIFDRLGAGNVYNPNQRNVPYLWVYTTRPDGQRLRAGDTFRDSVARGTPWNEHLGTLLTASYYGDGVLLSQYIKQGGAYKDDYIFEFLWRDTSLKPLPISSLPTSRYFGSPFGWMVARTGWDDNVVIAEMKINEYNFANHQHLDAGAFQLYYHGPLALDSGLYQKTPHGLYGSEHAKNYAWRTIAHNSLLIHDPAEVFAKDYGNDGGQRLPNGRTDARTLEMLLDPKNGYRTGKVLAHGFGPDAHTPDYTILQGDITAAYNSDKAREVTRTFVFLNLRDTAVPAAFITFDRVTSTNPAFKKYWLLHTQEEPQINADGTSATIDAPPPQTPDAPRGRLFLNVLLPKPGNTTLTKIGGEGKEFFVFGKNYPNNPTAEFLAKSSVEQGRWRLELSSSLPAAEDVFLTVMQTADTTTTAHYPVKLLQTPTRTVCVIATPQTDWLILFRKDGKRSAMSDNITIASSKNDTTPTRVLLTDLTAGSWTATRASDGEKIHVEVTDHSGAGYFECSPGIWTISINAPSLHP